MSSASIGEITRDMLDLVAREVARIRDRSGSAGARADVGRTKLPADRVQNALLIEAKQLRALSSSPDSEVGRMPPQPPTVRGEMGAGLVRLVRRALFWYTRQINEIVCKIADVVLHHAQEIDDAVTTVTRNSQVLEQLSGITASLGRDQTALRGSVRKQESNLEQLTTPLAGLQRNVEQLTGSFAGFTRDLTALRVSMQQQENGLEQLSAAMAALQSAVQQQQESDRLISAKIEAISAASEHSGRDLASLRLDSERSESVWKELSAGLRAAELYSQAIRAELAVERSRVSLLMQQRRQPVSAEKPPLPAQDTNLGAELGPLYLQFENAFRGSRAEIKGRAVEYLPLLREKGIGTAHMPVLDLGCGRGEWLELLSENGLTASGVESNAAFVEECHTRGFAVHHGDAIRFLQDALPESQGAITGFHIIEHLPFSELVALLDEAVRVLKPCGILMLETPNPANLIVGAHTFYLDPTHIRPLPADLMRFLVEARGFCDVRIVPLHPFPECHRLDQQDDRTAEVLNKFLFGPRDYMIVGERP